MKKRLIIIVVLAILAPILTIEIKKQLFEKRVTTYLMETKSYEKEEIQSIQAKWHFAGLPKYWIDVIFFDEPNVIYTYFAHNKGNVWQAEYASIDGPPLTVEQLKHFDEFR